MAEEIIWVSQSQIARRFRKSVQNVRYHLLKEIQNTPKATLFGGHKLYDIEEVKKWWPNK